MKIKLLGKNLEELKRLVADEGLPGFTARQIAQWLYVKKVRSIDDMTNLSKAARAALSEKYEVGVTPYAGLQVSSDGTKKYLFPVKCSHKRGLNPVQKIPSETRSVFLSFFFKDIFSTRLRGRFVPTRTLYTRNVRTPPSF